MVNKTNTMENSNVNNLIEEGKKQLAALEVELTKLANTAEKVAGVKGEEVAQKAEALITETKTQIEAKKKEIMESDEFKKLEEDGKKAFGEVEGKLNELSAQVETVTQDLSAKLKNFFGST
jgi:hypothetical protein